jgi:membrane protease YdiL (CAAX protease family)
MLWKKTWQPEAVLMLAGGIVLSLCFCSLALELLRHFGVAGFKADGAAGNVLVATLSLHGAAIVMGTIFLKMHGLNWCDVLGLRNPNWPRHLLLAFVVFAAVLPLMFGLKLVSTLLLQQIGWPVEDQNAVEMFFNIKSVWLRVYMGFFAVVIAPVAEEFIFRGLLFSTAKKFGWPKCGAVGVSLLFALIHDNAPIFLPLFVFALALTWLYEKTEGLIAPIFAHSLFNAANLVLLVVAEKSGIKLQS